MGNVLNLINSGESKTLEFKEKLPKMTPLPRPQDVITR